MNNEEAFRYTDTICPACRRPTKYHYVVVVGGAGVPFCEPIQDQHRTFYWWRFVKEAQ